MELDSHKEEIDEDSEASNEDNKGGIFAIKRKSYTIEEKLFFVKLLDTYSQHAMAKDYNISEKNLRRWKQQESLLLELKLKRFKRRIIGDEKPGVDPKTKDIEKDLVLFIKHARELEISIGTNEIIIEAYRLMPELKELSYKFIHKWCDRFLLRHGYTLRKVTYIGQPVRDDASDMIIKFILDIKQKKIDCNINDNYQLIANMDETPVWFEMFMNETIERIGAKEVKIKSFGCDKNGISLVLTVLANGEKLKPVIIFKGKTDNRLEKKLQNNIHVKNNEILVKCQDNAWVSNEIFLF